MTTSGSRSKPYRKPVWPTLAEVMGMKPAVCPKCGAGAHLITYDWLEEYWDARDLFFRCRACARCVYPTLEATMDIIHEPTKPRENTR